MSQTFKHAVRALVHRPGFTALVVLIMALCIGGNAAVFSAANAVLFQNLPYVDADRLVVFDFLHQPTGATNDISFPDYVDFQQRITLMEEVSPFSAWHNRLLRVGESNERIGAQYAPSGHLKTLGVKPHLGRLFTSEEDKAGEGGAAVVLLSYELWQRHFAGDPQIVGKTVQLNDSTYTVIGVLPSGFFDIAEWSWDADVWVPAVMVNELYPAIPNILQQRDRRIWQVMGRLKPGVSHEEALQELKSIAAQLASEYPTTNEDYSVRMQSLRQYIFEDLHPSMRTISIGALLILLVGCANIAGLLLVRLVDRRNELFVRLALGGSRLHLIRQVLVESLILAFISGLFGVGLAFLGINLLSSWVELPAFTSLKLDGAVLGAILVASASTGILFGLPPALGAARVEASGGGLVRRNRSASGGSAQGVRSRNVLLVFQVAVVTVLLLVAGLLLRSFMELRGTGVGFETDQMLTLRLSFATPNYPDRESVSIAGHELMRRMQGVPGVESAAIWGPGIPGVFSFYALIQPEGAPEGFAPLRTHMHSVSTGAIQSLGMSLLQGREPTSADTQDTQRVTVLTRSVAEAFWPGEDPIGKRIQRTDRPDPIMEVVGIIADNKLHDRLSATTDHQMVLSFDQRSTSVTTLLVRTVGLPFSVVDRVREEVRQVDGDIPVYDINTFDQILKNGERFHRINAAIVGMYAFLALLFALLGLYGMLAYTVVQRTQEIGLRVAFGALPGDILKMIMGRGLALVGTGIVIGVMGALLMTRLLRNLLYGVGERDPMTFIIVVLTFIALTCLSTFLTARRALRIEPSEALRYE